MREYMEQTKIEELAHILCGQNDCTGCSFDGGCRCIDEAEAVLDAGYDKPQFESNEKHQEKFIYLTEGEEKYCIPYNNILYICSTGVWLFGGIFIRTNENYDDIVQQVKRAVH